MRIEDLMRLFFWVCIACIVSGAALALLMLWDIARGEYVYKLWSSIAILFLASSTALAIGRTYLGKRDKTDDSDADPPTFS